MQMRNYITDTYIIFLHEVKFTLFSARFCVKIQDGSISPEILSRHLSGC